MSEDAPYAQLPISALRPLVGEETADFAVYLPGETPDAPVLYRRAGSELSMPDFARLAEHGMRSMFVRTEDLVKCERILEEKLTEVVRRSDISPEQKSGLIFHVGKTVAKDLALTSEGSLGPAEMHRASSVVDNIIASVLSDPLVAANMLHMSEHELSTASHMFAVSALAIVLGAKVVGPDPAILRELGLAGMMHDLGKLAIAPEILCKREPLTPRELRIIQQHPIESVRRLGDDSKATPTVRQMILQHHERIDGRGYPLGLGESELLLPSRILSVVDAFHAMIGHRIYRTPLGAVDANRCLQVQSGRQFDAAVLKCWNTLFEEQYALAPNFIAGAVAETKPSGTGPQEYLPMAAETVKPKKRPPRHRCTGKVEVPCVYAGRLGHCEPTSAEFPAAIGDISTQGACLHVPFAIYRGEVLNVRLPVADGTQWVSCRVAWCRPTGGRGFKAGLRFVARISEQQARELAAVAALMDDEGLVLLENKGETMAELQTTPAEPNASAGPMREAPGQVLSRLATMAKIPKEDEAAVIRYAASSDPEVRREVLKLLVRIPRREARSAFLALLRDPDTGVRECAAAIVGAMRMQDSTHALQPLMSDPVESVALAATISLAKLGDQKALAALIEILRTDKPSAKFAARAYGETVGQRFAANAEGVNAARRYVEASRDGKRAKPGMKAAV